VAPSPTTITTKEAVNLAADQLFAAVLVALHRPGAPADAIGTVILFEEHLADLVATVQGALFPRGEAVDNQSGDGTPP